MLEKSSRMLSQKACTREGGWNPGVLTKLIEITMESESMDDRTKFS